MQRNCPTRMASGANTVPIGSSSAPAPKGPSSATASVFTSITDTGRNYLYALTTRHELEASTNFITGMLRLFSRDVYSLIDLGSTFSYMTPFVAAYFGFGR